MLGTNQYQYQIRCVDCRKILFKCYFKEVNLAPVWDRLKMHAVAQGLDLANPSAAANKDPAEPTRELKEPTNNDSGFVQTPDSNPSKSDDDDNSWHQLGEEENSAEA